MAENEKETLGRQKAERDMIDAKRRVIRILVILNFFAIF
jgi:hypothetical protein